jgi:hypothetical protein
MLAAARSSNFVIPRLPSLPKSIGANCDPELPGCD